MGANQGPHVVCPAWARAFGRASASQTSAPVQCPVAEIAGKKGLFFCVVDAFDLPASTRMEV